MNDSKEMDDVVENGVVDGGYHTMSVPHWAKQEVKALMRVLHDRGVGDLPSELRTEAQALVAKNRRPFPIGVVVGIACRAMRLDLAAKTSARTSPKAPPRK